MKTNKLAKKNREFTRLKKENKSIKENDNYTWNDVTILENRVRTGNNNIRILEQNISQLEKKFDIKKFKYTEIIQ